MTKSEIGKGPVKLNDVNEFDIENILERMGYVWEDHYDEYHQFIEDILFMMLNEI